MQGDRRAGRVGGGQCTAQADVVPGGGAARIHQDSAAAGVDGAAGAAHADAVQFHAVGADAEGAQVQLAAGLERGGGASAAASVDFAAEGQRGGVGQLERADAGERAEVGNDVVAGQGHCAASVALQCAGGDDAALRDRAADGLAGHAQGHRPGPGCPAGGDGP